MKEYRERVNEKVEILWPYGGLTVRAFERKLRDEKLTLTEQALRFETKIAQTTGFDSSNPRLIPLVDSSTVEVVYSIQASSKRLALNSLWDLQRERLIVFQGKILAE